MLKRRKKRGIVRLGVIFIILSIFIGSYFLSKGSNSKIKEKNLSIRDVNEVKEYSNNEEIKNNTEENIVIKEKENEIIKSENTNDNKNNSNSVSAKKTNNNSKGKLPVSNPDAVALCKKAQTSDEKNIYLTFDDGPSPNITPKILKILKEYDVPATFFVLGSRAELYPDLLKQEFEEGHYIANHGYSHQYSSIYSSVQAVIDEYNSCEKAIQDGLGNKEYHTLLFRFPGGSSGGPYNDLKQEAKSKLENMGIACTNWNCLNGDAEGVARNKDQLINRLYETAKG